MKKPANISNQKDFDKRGEVFSTPVLTKGKTWLPVTQLLTAGILTRFFSKRTPDRRLHKNFLSGLISMILVLGSEWGHNLAHTLAASWINKPTDGIRVSWGMPLLHYEDVNDRSTTPRQHIFRALGGPIFNLVMAPISWVFRSFTKGGTIARDAADSLLTMNIFLGIVSLLPIPGIDGGPILKWSLVERGKTQAEADQTVRDINWGVSAVCAAGSAAAFKKKKTLLGLLGVSFSVLSLLIASGLLRESD